MAANECGGVVVDNSGTEEMVPVSRYRELETRLQELNGQWQNAEAEKRGYMQRLSDEESKTQRAVQRADHVRRENEALIDSLAELALSMGLPREATIPEMQRRWENLIKEQNEIIVEAQSCQDHSDRMEDQAQAAEKRYALAREQAEHYAEVADDWRKTCVAMAELIRLSNQPMVSVRGADGSPVDMKPGPFKKVQPQWGDKG